MNSPGTENKHPWIKEYESLPDEEIRTRMANLGVYSPAWLAGRDILKKRALDRDKGPALLASLNEHVARMDTRLTVMESEATKPAWKTWAFWLAATAIIVAFLAWVHGSIR